MWLLLNFDAQFQFLLFIGYICRVLFVTLINNKIFPVYGIRCNRNW